MELSLFRVQNGEGKYAVQHGGRLFGTETLVQVNDDLRIAVRLEHKLVKVSQSERIVNLAVAEQPNVRVRFEAHWLHAIREIVDLQSVKAQMRVRNTLDGLDTRRVGSAVSDLEAISEAVQSNSLVTETKKCPDAAHFVFQSAELCETAVKAHERGDQ